MKTEGYRDCDRKPVESFESRSDRTYALKDRCLCPIKTISPWRGVMVHREATAQRMQTSAFVSTHKVKASSLTLTLEWGGGGHGHGPDTQSWGEIGGHEPEGSAGHVAMGRCHPSRLLFPQALLAFVC